MKPSYIQTYEVSSTFLSSKNSIEVSIITCVIVIDPIINLLQNFVGVRIYFMGEVSGSSPG